MQRCEGFRTVNQVGSYSLADCRRRILSGYAVTQDLRLLDRVTVIHSINMLLFVLAALGNHNVALKMLRRTCVAGICNSC